MTDYIIAEIAFLHYEKGMSQQEIAKYFKLSKMTISRMLQRAKEQKIVETFINLPFKTVPKLEEAIERKYNIEKAYVIRSTKNQDKELKKLIGSVASFYLTIENLNNRIIGIGLGETISQMIRNLPEIKTTNLHIVQLLGGLADVTDANPFNIVQEFCQKLNATGTYLTSYAVVDNAEMKIKILEKKVSGQSIYDLWEKCDKAIFGIGSIRTGTLLSKSLVPPQIIKELNQLGGIGDILGHCFNDEGKFLHTDLENRLVSIPVDILNNIKERFAIAGGIYKAQAIKGALKTGIITHLLTDEITAAEIIK